MGTAGPRRMLFTALRTPSWQRRYRLRRAPGIRSERSASSRSPTGVRIGRVGGKGAARPMRATSRPTDPGLGDRRRDDGGCWPWAAAGRAATPRRPAGRCRRPSARPRRRARRRAPISASSRSTPASAASAPRSAGVVVDARPRPHPHDGAQPLGRPLAEDRDGPRRAARPDPGARPVRRPGGGRDAAAHPRARRGADRRRPRSPGSRCSPRTAPAAPRPRRR